MFRNLRIPGLAIAAACVVLGWSGSGTAAAQSPCANLGGAVGPGQICHVYNVTPDYTLDFSFPVDYPDERTLTDYLTDRRDEFVSFADQHPPGPERSGRTYELKVSAKTYRSGGQDTGTVSVVLTIADDEGLAHVGHPAISFKAFNYDLGTRAAITFDTLFKPGTNPVAAIYPAYRSALQKRWGSEPLPPLDGELETATYQNFAITDDAVIFFFGEGQVGEVGGSPLRISMSRTELAPFLA